MEPKKHPVLTFRARRIPYNVEEKYLAKFLADVVPGCPDPKLIDIGSFAPSVDDFEKPPSYTATVSFRDLPSILANGAGRWEFQVPWQSSSVVFDLNFQDFTPLNSIDPSKHEYDCIAISGLASHAFGSWRSRDSSSGSGHMWLRDSLPVDKPNFRVMIYGYDSHLEGSHSFQTIKNIASKFQKRLLDIRPPGHPQKPIMFFAHSLGGVVLKQSLLYLANGGRIETEALRTVKAAVLFGVPNRGMYISHLRAMVESQPNDQIIADLSENSPYLTDLDEKFHNVISPRDIKLIAAFETQQSPTVVRDDDGVFRRNGPRRVLVAEESATSGALSDPLSTFPIDEDHSNMVKFSKADPNYSRVVSAITRALLGTDARQQTSRERVEAPSIGKAALSLLYMQQRAQRKDPNVITDDEYTELVSSLRFDEVDQRLKDISKPDFDSYRWIFKDEKIGFESWLQQPSGLYWVRGKAGAGKSTLLKYLHGSEACKQLARSGLGPDEIPISVWVFFHERGTVLQQSYEGLLRSLLLKFAENNQQLRKAIFDAFVDPRFSDPRTWSQDKMEWALMTLKRLKSAKFRITIFLDALDEFYGAPETIVRVIRDLTKPLEDSFVNVKICFASRPWDVFVKAFSTCSGFQIQDYTNDDIRNYVHSTVTKFPMLQQLFNERLQPMEAREIADTIIARAEGVFLWVKLVLDDLREAATSQPDLTMAELQQILADLPDELEDHYTRTIDRIPNDDRHDAFTILEIVYRSNTIIFLDELFYASECAKGSTCAESLSLLRRFVDLKLTEKNMAMRLRNLCGGLIEVLKPRQFEHSRVQFIHRTVKDFFGKPEIKERISGSAYKFRLSTENGYTYLAKYQLTRMRLLEDDADPMDYQKAFDYARLAEETSGAHMATFLDSIPTHIFAVFKYEGCPDIPSLKSSPCRILAKSAARRKLRQWSACDSAISFATCANLEIYLQQALRSSEESKRNTTGVLMPPLHCAVLAVRGAMKGSIRNNKVTTILSHRDCIHRVKSILSLPDYQKSWDGSTALSLIFEERTLSEYLIIQDFDLADVATELLKGGEDPNIAIDIVTDGQGQTTVTTTLLHMCPALAGELLETDVDVNASDSGGWTPIDRYICAFVNTIPKTPAEDKMPPFQELLKDALLILANQGGKMTWHGNKYHRRLCEAIRLYMPKDKATYNSFRAIPQLADKSSVWGKLFG